MKKVALVSFVLLSSVPVVRGMAPSQKSEMTPFEMRALTDGRPLWLALREAASRGNPGKVRKLLEWADISDLVASGVGNTAHGEALRQYYRLGTTIETGGGRGAGVFGERLDQFADYKEVIDLLEDAERKFGVGDALMQAVYQGDLNTVRRLLAVKGGGDVTAKDKFGKTALEIAARGYGKLQKDVGERGLSQTEESRLLADRREIMNLLEVAAKRGKDMAERRGRARREKDRVGYKAKE